ncbi:putative tail fiber protein from prophage [Escherichia coli]|uniref:Putative tail fiber protein from prophage n=1 Tax=Escherichia coli TaxID=562 RepID=A0A377D5Z8_ECOLX|nr:putative tail fiber protein from prophage [Escherichia coli]
MQARQAPQERMVPPERKVRQVRQGHEVKGDQRGHRVFRGRLVRQVLRVKRGHEVCREKQEDRARQVHRARQVNPDHRTTRANRKAGTREIYSIGTYIIAALAPYTTDIGRTYQPGETVQGSRLKRCAIIKDASGNYMKANTDGIDGNLSSVPGSWMVCNEITSTNDNEGIGLFQRAY